MANTKAIEWENRKLRNTLEVHARLYCGTGASSYDGCNYRELTRECTLSLIAVAEVSWSFDQQDPQGRSTNRQCHRSLLIKKITEIRINISTKLTWPWKHGRALQVIGGINYCNLFEYRKTSGMIDVYPYLWKAFFQFPSIENEGCFKIYFYQIARKKIINGYFLHKMPEYFNRIGTEQWHKHPLRSTVNFPITSALTIKVLWLSLNLWKYYTIIGKD